MSLHCYHGSMGRQRLITYRLCLSFLFIFFTLPARGRLASNYSFWQTRQFCFSSVCFTLLCMTFFLLNDKYHMQKLLSPTDSNIFPLLHTSAHTHTHTHTHTMLLIPPIKTNVFAIHMYYRNKYLCIMLRQHPLKFNRCCRINTRKIVLISLQGIF